MKKRCAVAFIVFATLVASNQAIKCYRCSGTDDCEVTVECGSAQCATLRTFQQSGDDIKLQSINRGCANSLEMIAGYPYDLFLCDDEMCNSDHTDGINSIEDRFSDSPKEDILKKLPAFKNSGWRSFISPTLCGLLIALNIVMG